MLLFCNRTYFLFLHGIKKQINDEYEISRSVREQQSSADQEIEKPRFHHCVFTEITRNRPSVFTENKGKFGFTRQLFCGFDRNIQNKYQ